MSAPAFAENALNYRQTIARSIHDAMQGDPSVFFFGEDIGAAGGPFKTTAGLFEVFGPHRVRDTPISEQAIVGAAMGAFKAKAIKAALQGGLINGLITNEATAELL